MHSVRARWFVETEEMKAAHAALGKLAKDVKAKEPDTLIYLVDKAAPGSLAPACENEIVILEGYRDERAFDAHLTGPARTAFLKAHGDLFVPNFPSDGGPRMLVSTPKDVGGFVREGCA